MEVEMEDAFDVEWLGGFSNGSGSGEFEVDFEYEYDASSYFDFSREETEEEARVVEMWFATAPDYAPSQRRIGNYYLNKNVNEYPELENVQDSSQVNGHPDIETGPPLAVFEKCYKGWTLDDHMSGDNKETVRKPITKKPFLRCSTLMKPTASQIAKQIWPRELSSSSWLQKPPLQKSVKSHGDPFENGCQAPKRQKLEGGCKQKIQAFDMKQEPSLMHKISQKKKEMAPSDSAQTTLKLTIPWEPELQTARRARLVGPKIHKEQQEIAAPCDSTQARLKPTIPQERELLTARRARIIWPKNHKKQQENAVSTSFLFKARPLNRKILEAPSMPLHKRSTPQQPEFQEFHLKTSERAIQHLYAGSSSSVGDCTLNSTGTMNMKRLYDQAPALSQPVNDSMCIEYETGMPRFKAHPLTKKESHFSTYKQCQLNPPTDLFDKLSLAPGTEQNSMPNTRHPQPRHVKSFKDSKENIVKPGQQEDEINHESKLEHKRIVLTQIHQSPCRSRSGIR